ncbi:MAG: DUF899 domain-containing protein [Longimicrobiales bacterium]
MPRVVSRDEWLKERLAHLASEKALDKQRDALSAERRQLPWVKVIEDYVFETEEGEQSLGDLFGNRSQLIVQHFMFGADWDAGCPSCSYWADGFNGFRTHLEQRDAAFVAISTAPLESLLAYRARMGWSFRWVSSGRSSFNRDYGVTFSASDIENGSTYNYKKAARPGEMPGTSVFAMKDGAVFHTYSTYARGLDKLNGAYHYIDLLPKGRNEEGLSYTQAWVRRRDEYEDV